LCGEFFSDARTGFLPSRWVELEPAVFSRNNTIVFVGVVGPGLLLTPHSFPDGSFVLAARSFLHSSTPAPRPASESHAMTLHPASRSVETSDLEVVPKIGVIYENEMWLEPLFSALGSAGIPHERIDVRDAAFGLLKARRNTLYLNRVSPSSYLRGNGPAIAHAHAMLAALEADGAQVINGSVSFRLETSKVEQQLLLDRLGVDTPQTIVFNNHDAVLERARDLPFPAILKPDTGGSGAFVRKVDTFEELPEILEKGPEVFAPGNLMLLQEYLAPVDGSIIRTEFVDGELLFAMKVRPVNTFNLCPAVSCVRNPIAEGIEPDATFEPYPDIPPEAVAQGREILRAARLDIGGIEYIDTQDGRRCFFDINATSVYRDDIQLATGVDGIARVCGYLARELAKEDAKLSRGELKGRR